MCLFDNFIFKRKLSNFSNRLRKVAFSYQSGYPPGPIIPSVRCVPAPGCVDERHARLQVSLADLRKLSILHCFEGS
jgi:hypothetical protein